MSPRASGGRPRPRLSLLRRPRDERGAYAVLMSMLVILLVALAAIGVDIASNVAAKQVLRDTLDQSAQAGASALPDAVAARKDALAAARQVDGAANPTIDLWCVVGSKPVGASFEVNASHIPGTCDPGAGAPYTAAKYPGLKCDAAICAIPCPDSAPKCNTIRVADSDVVPYAFAPAIGYQEGSTGNQVATACTGSCGSEVPNPMDVVFMADRTRSMQPADRELMKDAILDSLKTMTPSLHHVAFGTLHATANSLYSWQCQTNASEASSAADGKWVPIGFSTDYLTSAATPTLNTNSALVKGVDCLPESPKHGTHLAAALKGAARYLLTNATRGGTPKKVLIFETDGQPDETMGGSYTGLGNDTDFGAGGNGYCANSYGDDYYPSNYSDVSLRYWCKNYVATSAGLDGCKNLERIAAEAKALNITVITVGFGQAGTAGCTVTRKHNRNDPAIPWQTGGEKVRDYLAAAASPHPETKQPSTASDCSDPTQRGLENADGDFFFCAAAGSELGPIFKTAIAQVSSGIRLLRLPI
ncbi:pilus assembly protein [Nocardioides solisilvae]|uniref:pilus assembly protein n=1 Tax=Nocardioides solisilvae TaxID=1542435 RepID=UPI000D74338D|nr:pilus assembly protein [Nocardioides solisilvae]